MQGEEGDDRRRADRQHDASRGAGDDRRMPDEPPGPGLKRAHARTTHKLTLEGATAASTVVTRSVWIRSTSTWSRNRCAKASAVRPASYAARSKRRSTAFCVRRRSGWNAAAAASVEAATAMPEEKPSPVSISATMLT